MTGPGVEAAAAPVARPRRGYLDWLRGLAVLVMIEAHVVDSWTSAAYRSSEAFGWSLILGGMGAPLFLLLAGVSVALSAGSKHRRHGDAGAAAAAVARRGLEIFALAFLFRLQAWVLSGSSVRTLLRVDILNIMGPSIALAAGVWVLARSVRARALLYLGATLVMTLLTPLVRATTTLGALPDPLEAYLRPVQGLTVFAFFPWAGFVFAGGLLGVFIDASRTRESETRLNALFAGGGVALAAGAYAASFLPSPYARSDFWTSAPTFFLIRVGVMTAVVALAYAWCAVRPAAWSPMEQLGRTSLFIYWIHVEMVYGLVSLRLHRALSLGMAWAALVPFSIFLLGCSLLKDHIVRRVRGPAALRR